MYSNHQPGSSHSRLRQHVLAVLPFSLFVLCLFSAHSHAIELAAHSASYTAKIEKGLSLKGTAIRELKQLDNKQWRYSFDVDSRIADIRESVTFDWQAESLQPHLYSYELSGFFIRDRNQRITFEKDSLQVNGRHDKHTWQLEAPADALDRLGYQLQLMLDIQSGKTEMSYQVIHKGRIEQESFRVVREETIETALGKMNSIVVEKVREADSKRQTLLWFAKDYAFLLLKMYQVEKDGEEYEIHIRDAKLIPLSPPERPAEPLTNVKSDKTASAIESKTISPE